MSIEFVKERLTFSPDPFATFQRQLIGAVAARKGTYADKPSTPRPALDLGKEIPLPFTQLSKPLVKTLIVV